MKKQIAFTILFTLLIAANTNEASRKPASYRQLESTINATQSPMPINDMYKVRGKVNQAQDQYKKAREAQYEQAQQYKDMLK